jgi:hypothetical protein
MITILEIFTFNSHLKLSTRFFMEKKVTAVETLQEL